MTRPKKPDLSPAEALARVEQLIVNVSRADAKLRAHMDEALSVLKWCVPEFEARETARQRSAETGLEELGRVAWQAYRETVSSETGFDWLELTPRERTAWRSAAQKIWDMAR